MSLNGMAESRRQRCHHRVWLKCSKTVAPRTQVLPVCGSPDRRFQGVRAGQAPSPVLFVAAPVRPVVPSPSPICEGRGAPRGATTYRPRLRRGMRPVCGRTRPAALHVTAFLSPAPCFRAAKLRATDPHRGGFRHPLIAASSSHQRQPVLVPADDWPGPPDPAVTSRSGGRRHPAPSSRRL